MASKTMYLENAHIDLTKSWLDYYFPSAEEKYTYNKLIQNMVRENITCYWNDTDFIRYMSFQVINYLAKKDWMPLSKPLILIAISRVFYNKHADFMLKSIKHMRRNKNR